MQNENNNRGEINNLERKKQVYGFSGLKRERNITPTDIDGLIEYSGCYFIYMEGKYKNAILSAGQLEALEAVTRSHWSAGHDAILLIFSHSMPVDEIVFIKSQFVTSIFSKFKIPYLCGDTTGKRDNWFYPVCRITIEQAITVFENHFHIFPKRYKAADNNNLGFLFCPPE